MLEKRISAALAFLFALNVTDALLTIVWVRLGVAQEANPLMATLVSHHTEVFVVTKLLSVWFGCRLLWRYRKQSLAQGLLVVCVITYCVIVAAHAFMTLELHKAPLKEIQECVKNY